MANIYSLSNIKNLIGNSYVHSQSGMVFEISENGFEIDGNTFTNFSDLRNYISSETGIYINSILASFFYNTDTNKTFVEDAA